MLYLLYLHIFFLLHLSLSLLFFYSCCFFGAHDYLILHIPWMRRMDFSIFLSNNINQKMWFPVSLEVCLSLCVSRHSEASNYVKFFCCIVLSAWNTFSGYRNQSIPYVILSKLIIILDLYVIFLLNTLLVILNAYEWFSVTNLETNQQSLDVEYKIVQSSLCWVICFE